MKSIPLALLLMRKSIFGLTTLLIYFLCPFPKAIATEWDSDILFNDPVFQKEMIGEQSDWENPKIYQMAPNLKVPLDANEQSVGFFSNGSLFNPNSLVGETQDWVKVFQSRNSGYVNLEMMNALTGLAQSLKLTFPTGERLQVGDISLESGGQIFRHASHQNGLDADVIYLRNNYEEQSPLRNVGFEENFVSNNQITVNFDVKRNYFAFRYLVQQHSINRIFVDSAIKVAMCRFSTFMGFPTEDIEMLRRLRPLQNHADHFHLRLKCPSNSPRCKNQVEPPEGSGC